MPETTVRRMAASLAVFLAAAGFASAQADLSLKDIMRKNLDASGGRPKLAQIKNLSFKTGDTRNVVSAAGELKLITGKDPVITDVVLVNGSRVRRNALNVASQVTGFEKTVYETLAGLYAGAFSLVRFEGRLKLEGVRSFGSVKLYHLTPKVQEAAAAVHFYVDSGDFCLKRLVFQGKTPEGDKIEVNYDFAPFEETAGLKLPLSWFSSQVGARGATTEVTDVAVNQPLEKGYFSSDAVNAGTVDVTPGEMKGNVLDINTSPFGLALATNWTRKDSEKAGFKTGDKLTLLAGGEKYEANFYALTTEVPLPVELAKGTRLLAPISRSGDSFSVLIIGGDAALQTRLKVLAPISVKKAGN